jgi:hypothetical protein
LTYASVFQVLDPTAEDSPLTRAGSNEDEDEDNDSEDDSDCKESYSEESDSDLEDGENETVNDKLRIAVREALGSAAPLTDTVMLPLLYLLYCVLQHPLQTQ